MTRSDANTQINPWHGTRPKIGFVGLGNMGEPMVMRLLQAGYAVTGFDTAEAALRTISARTGMSTAASLAELARASDVIITMLPTSRIVDKVLNAEQGLLSGLRDGAIIIEMSSGVPAHTRQLALQVEAAGGRMVDAPVSGGVQRARSGELAIMFGGPALVLERVRPLLESMGKSILHTGATGTAHAMKALNNLVSAGGFLIGIEALLIGQRFGLDPSVMVDALNASTGMNNSTQKKFKQFVLSRRFDSGFGLDLMVKDLTIALGIATEGETPAPFASLCREVWAGAAKLLGEGQDHTAVARFSERLAATELRPAEPPGARPF